MSGGEAQAAEETAEPEPRQMSERTARVVLLVIAVGALWGVVAVFPWIAYVIVGVGGTLGWQKVRGWIGRRGSSSEDDLDEVTEADLVQALHSVAGPNVFLADLAAELGAPVDEARALLEACGIRVRRAVRNGGSTGVGVHRTDLPPLLSPTSETPVTAVDQGQHNQPTRPTAERIGLAGVVLKDGSETIRHHRV